MKVDKGKHGKFDNIRIGLYLIVENKENNTFVLAYLEGENIEEPINGKLLKIFFIY